MTFQMCEGEAALVLQLLAGKARLYQLREGDIAIFFQLLTGKARLF